MREFQDTSFFARIPAGKDVFIEGDRADAIALLISGVVRVYKIGVTGREITLYRFGLGESCILTANAILSQKSFPAIATVEEDAEAVMIPAEAFKDWVKITHQEIAADLGSSREVISRILEDFSRSALIDSDRGTIDVLDMEGPENRAVM